MSDLSLNNFVKDIPTKSVNVFSDADKGKSANVFAKDGQPLSDNLASGENTTPGVAGTDNVFGVIAGEGRAGGFDHFKARTTPPVIDH